MSRDLHNILKNKLLEMVNEQKKSSEDRKYEYGGLLAKLEIPFWDNILSQISDEETFMEGEYGKEHETHCTVLYGIDCEQTGTDDIEELIKDVEPFNVYLTEISTFNNEEFDVLKFDVESEEIHELHNKIAENVPHTQLYPKYIPHVTIAYLKKGEGEKYTKKLDKPIKLEVNELYFTDTNRNKTHFKLNQSS